MSDEGVYFDKLINQEESVLFKFLLHKFSDKKKTDFKPTFVGKSFISKDMIMNTDESKKDSLIMHPQSMKNFGARFGHTIKEPMLPKVLPSNKT